jgi:hypothetical protein
MSEEFWICTKQLRKPIPRPLGLMAQPFELSARPADDIEIDPLQGRTQLGPKEVAVVVDPALNVRVVHLGQVLQGLVAAMMKSPPPDGLADGLQRLWAGGYSGLNYEYMRDFVPIAGIALTPQVMEVNPSVPVKTVPEFIAYAKANAGKLNYASAGIGTPQHLCGELFKMTSSSRCDDATPVGTTRLQDEIPARPLRYDRRVRLIEMVYCAPTGVALWAVTLPFSLAQNCNYRFAAHYREGYEGSGVYPLSRSPDLKVAYGL